jgi:hypothetical protein
MEEQTKLDPLSDPRFCFSNNGVFLAPWPQTMPARVSDDSARLADASRFGGNPGDSTPGNHGVGRL